MTVSRLLLIVGIVLANVSMAQERSPLTRERIDALLQSSYAKIDGKKNPELVPYRVRWHLFFQRWNGRYGAELKPQLTASDHAILSEFAATLSQVLKKDDQDYHDAWMSIGARAKDMDGVEIGAAVQAATNELIAKQEARCRAVLDRLTPEGRKVVNDFAFARVRPQTSTEDQMVVALAEPEFYKAQVVALYEMEVAGIRPEDLLPPPPRSRPKNGVQSAGSERGRQSIESAETGQLGSSPAQ